MKPTKCSDAMGFIPEMQIWFNSWEPVSCTLFTKWNKKNWMIISTDTKETVNKIKYKLLIKVSQTRKRNSLYVINKIHLWKASGWDQHCGVVFKPLPAVLASLARGLAPLLLILLPANAPRKATERLKCLGPCTHTKSPEEAFDSWLMPGPAWPFQSFEEEWTSGWKT